MTYVAKAGAPRPIIAISSKRLPDLSHLFDSDSSKGKIFFEVCYVEVNPKGTRSRYLKGLVGLVAIL